MRILFSIATTFSCFFIFSQKNIVNIDSIIKADSYTVFKNISYGPDKKNNLDLWIADQNLKHRLLFTFMVEDLALGVRMLHTQKIILKELKGCSITIYHLLQLITDSKTMMIFFCHH